MDFALYHPLYGYYCSGKDKIGSRGDYFTSVSLGKDFGELFALQLFDCWQKLDSPDSFTLVEMGPGSGQLAVDILNYLAKNHPDFYQTINYNLIEISTQLQKEQKSYIQNHLVAPIDIDWLAWENLPVIYNGCFFSNELIDAFAVHLVEVHGGKLYEVYVTYTQGVFKESIGELSVPEIEHYFELIGVDITSYEEGYRTEVNILALKWLELVESKLLRGYIVSIDYGYTQGRYYHRQRTQGTLQCYWKQKRHNDPYFHPGEQDITAWVDFDGLEIYGKKLGLDLLGITKQALFLMSLGLGDRLNELSSGAYSLPEILKRRDALHQLIDPAGLGAFLVMIQGKGLEGNYSSLKGLGSEF